MYSRPHRQSEQPIHVPENYSGCAFSPATDDRIQNPTPTPNTVAEVPPPPKEKELPNPQSSIKTDVTSLFSGPLNMLGGIRFEELLLIGLIILLARTEQGSDVILWLALLLFCK